MAITWLNKTCSSFLVLVFALVLVLSAVQPVEAASMPVMDHTGVSSDATDCGHSTPENNAANCLTHCLQKIVSGSAATAGVVQNIFVSQIAALADSFELEVYLDRESLPPDPDLGQQIIQRHLSTQKRE